MESGVGESSLVMAPRGIKDATFPLRSHPRPRLALIAFGAILQYRAILFVVLVMHVGFVQALEAVVALHDRVGRRSVGRINGEDTGAMSLELGPNQSNDLLVVAKTVGRTVQRNESTAVVDVVEQRFGLIVGDFIDIRVNDQAVQLTQPVRVEGSCDVIGVLYVDPAGGKRRKQFCRAACRLMVSVVTKEQQFQPGICFGGASRRQKASQQTQDCCS